MNKKKQYLKECKRSFNSFQRFVSVALLLTLIILLICI